MAPIMYKLSYEEHETMHESKLTKLANKFPDIADEDECPKMKLEKVRNMMVTYSDQTDDEILEGLSIETRIMSWRNDNPELAKKGWLEIPPEEEHTTTLFVLHGLSGSGLEYKELGKRLLTLLPYETRSGLKIVCPTAATRCIFGEYYPAWFTYETDNSGKTEEDTICSETLKEAREELSELLDAEFEKVRKSSSLVYPYSDEPANIRPSNFNRGVGCFFIPNMNCWRK
ncbi:hypothetical protein DIPPA_21329 [Diplonema papillatum]|nr:hypothetical protein DIPPA_21329 [Diplonema papillatum]